MRTYRRCIELLAAAFVSIFLVGCDYYTVEYYRALWSAQCVEAKDIKLEAINSTTTCNGTPILIAAAASKDARLNGDAFQFLDFLVLELKFNINLQAPGTGLTAAMTAVDANNQDMARELILRSDLSIRDNQGRTVFHHLAAAMWNDYSDTLLASPNLGNLVNDRSNGQPSPMDIAIQKRNIAFVWRVALLTNNPAVFANLDNGFLFDVQAERGLPILGALGSRVFAPYRDGYTLLHFAAQNSLSELLRYLLERGADVTSVSVKGSPLALALRQGPEMTDAARLSRWKQTVELLLQTPHALNVPDAMNALMQSGRMEWIQTGLRATLPIYSYAGLELRHSESNSSFQNNLIQCFGLRSPCDAGKVNWSASQGLSAKPNAAQQNAAHYFYALVPVDFYKAVTGSYISDGFSWFTGVAAASGSLDEADVLGNLPVHSWLSSRARIQARNDRSEVSRLQLLLSRTSQPLAFNANHDSILSLAVMSGNPRLVKQILHQLPDARALIDVPNLLGRSPLQMARASGDKEMYEALRP